MAIENISGEEVNISTTLLDMMPDSGQISLKTGDADPTGFSGPILLEVGAADSQDSQGDILLASPFMHFKRSRTEAAGQSKYIRTCDSSDDSSVELASLFTDDNHAYIVKAQVIAKQIDGASGAANDSCMYELTACFVNDNGSLSMVGSQVKVVLHEADASFDANLSASGTDMKLMVNGANDKNVKWVAMVEKVSNGLS